MVRDGDGAGAAGAAHLVQALPAAAVPEERLGVLGAPAHHAVAQVARKRLPVQLEVLRAEQGRVVRAAALEAPEGAPRAQPGVQRCLGDPLPAGDAGALPVGVGAGLLVVDQLHVHVQRQRRRRVAPLGERALHGSAAGRRGRGGGGRGGRRTRGGSVAGVRLGRLRDAQHEPLEARRLGVGLCRLGRGRRAKPGAAKAIHRAELPPRGRAAASSARRRGRLRGGDGAASRQNRPGRCGRAVSGGLAFDEVPVPSRRGRAGGRGPGCHAGIRWVSRWREGVSVLKKVQNSSCAVVRPSGATHNYGAGVLNRRPLVSRTNQANHNSKKKDTTNQPASSRSRTSPKNQAPPQTVPKNAPVRPSPSAQRRSPRKKLPWPPRRLEPIESKSNRHARPSCGPAARPAPLPCCAGAYKTVLLPARAPDG